MGRWAWLDGPKTFFTSSEGGFSNPQWSASNRKCKLDNCRCTAFNAGSAWAVEKSTWTVSMRTIDGWSIWFDCSWGCLRLQSHREKDGKKESIILTYPKSWLPSHFLKTTKSKHCSTTRCSVLSSVSISPSLSQIQAKNLQNILHRQKAHSCGLKLDVDCAICP